MMLQCRAKEKDMAELFGKKYTNRTRFTRMCIGEAVFSLMDKKPYEEIRVSDIVKRAGVSRMTFYHYYEQKEDALDECVCYVGKKRKTGNSGGHCKNTGVRSCFYRRYVSSFV